MQEACVGAGVAEGGELAGEALGVIEVVVIPLADELATGCVDGGVAEVAEGGGAVGGLDDADAIVLQALEKISQWRVEVFGDNDQLAVWVGLGDKAVDGSAGEIEASAARDHHA